MRVRIPSPLHSYSAGSSLVEANGRTVDEVLLQLDARFPGTRFRIIDEQDAIRPHIRLFVDGKPTAALNGALTPTSELMIVCALSGG